MASVPPNVMLTGNLLEEGGGKCLLPEWFAQNSVSLMGTADMNTSKGKYLQLWIKQYFDKSMLLLWESVIDWHIANLNVIKLTILIECFGWN